MIANKSKKIKLEKKKNMESIKNGKKRGKAEKALRTNRWKKENDEINRK